MLLFFIVFILTGCPNPTPEAIDFYANVMKNTAVRISILDNDKLYSDCTVIITKEPEHGTIKINKDGTITYIPNIDYSETMFLIIN